MFYISKIFLLLIANLLFFTAITTAQNPWNIQWGNPHEAENPGSIFNIVRADQQGYVALRCKIPDMPSSSKPHKAALELYGKDLNFVKAGALDLEYKGQSMDYEMFVALKDKYFLLSSYYNAKQEKKYLFTRQVNLQALQAEGEFTKIMELDMTSKFRYAYFIPRFSPDSSLVMVYGSMSFQQDKKERFSLTVMGENMKVLWTKDLELPYPEKDTRVKGYTLDNKGNAYLLVTRNRSNKEKKAGDEIGTDYYVFAYLNNGNTVKEYKASLEQKYITDFVFTAMDNGDLFCAGFYNDIEDKKASGVVRDVKNWNNPNRLEEKIKGVFSYKINGVDGREYDKNIAQFSLDILSSDLSLRKQEKAKNQKDNSGPELKEYDVRQLHLQKDGSTLLIGEKFYYETISSSKGQTTEIPHHDDLLVVSLSPKGQISWASKVAKNQKGGIVDDYLFFPTADKQYFFYNNGFKRSDNYQVATISPGGKVTYSEFKAEEFDIQNCTLLSPYAQTLLLWSDSKSKARIGKLIFR